MSSDSQENSKDEKQDYIKVKGQGYDYAFSRGLLAHSLGLRGLPLNEAYKVAKKVNEQLKRNEIAEIDEDDLRRYVRDQALEMVGKESATQYNLIEKWHNSSTPLIVLISGSRGTTTADIGKALAEKLAIPRIVSTSIVTQIMRRMMSPELSPELHQKSYRASEKLRPIYSVLYDPVLIGFEEHARYPAEAVEALVKRALIEGLSMVIHGEHLVPRFLSDDLIENPSVLFVTINIQDAEVHKQLYLSGVKTKTKLRKKKENFPKIRKIHDYLVEEARNRKKSVIDTDDPKTVANKIYPMVLERLAELMYDKKYDEYQNLDPNLLHS